MFLPVTDALTGFYGTGKGRLYRTQDPGEKWDLIWSKPGTSDQRPRRLGVRERGVDNGYGRNFRGNGQADEECCETEEYAFCFFHGAKV